MLINSMEDINSVRQFEAKTAIIQDTYGFYLKDGTHTSNFQVQNANPFNCSNECLFYNSSYYFVKCILCLLVFEYFKLLFRYSVAVARNPVGVTKRDIITSPLNTFIYILSVHFKMYEDLLFIYTPLRNILPPYRLFSRAPIYIPFISVLYIASSYLFPYTYPVYLVKYFLDNRPGVPVEHYFQASLITLAFAYCEFYTQYSNPWSNFVLNINTMGMSVNKYMHMLNGNIMSRKQKNKLPVYLDDFEANTENYIRVMTKRNALMNRVYLEELPTVDLSFNPDTISSVIDISEFGKDVRGKDLTQIDKIYCPTIEAADKNIFSEKLKNYGYDDPDMIAKMWKLTLGDTFGVFGEMLYRNAEIHLRVGEHRMSEKNVGVKILAMNVDPCTWMARTFDLRSIFYEAARKLTSVTFIVSYPDGEMVTYRIEDYCTYSKVKTDADPEKVFFDKILNDDMQTNISTVPLFSYSEYDYYKNPRYLHALQSPSFYTKIKEMGCPVKELIPHYCQYDDDDFDTYMDCGILYSTELPENLKRVPVIIAQIYCIAVDDGNLELKNYISEVIKYYNIDITKEQAFQTRHKISALKNISIHHTSLRFQVFNAVPDFSQITQFLKHPMIVEILNSSKSFARMIVNCVAAYKFFVMSDLSQAIACLAVACSDAWDLSHFLRYIAEIAKWMRDTALMRKHVDADAMRDYDDEFIDMMHALKQKDWESYNESKHILANKMVVFKTAYSDEMHGDMVERQSLESEVSNDPYSPNYIGSQPDEDPLFSRSTGAFLGNIIGSISGADVLTQDAFQMPAPHIDSPGENQGNLFSNSALFKSFSIMVSAIVNAELLNLIPGIEDKFFRYLTYTESFLRTSDGMLSSVYNFLYTFYERAMHAWNAGDIRELLSVKSVATYGIRVSEFLEPSNRNKNEILNGCKGQLDEANVLRLEGERHVLKSTYAVVNTTALKRINEYIEVLYGIVYHQEMTPMPFGTILMSIPGLGKSAITKAMSAKSRVIIAEINGEFVPVVIPEGFEYSVPLHVKHFDGCNPTACKHIIFDDLQGSQSANNPNREVNIPELLTALQNIMPFTSPQASIEDKRVSSIKNYLTTITSNDYLFDFSKLGDNWDKLKRRFPFCWKILPSKEYIESGAKDLSEVPHLASTLIYQRQSMVHQNGVLTFIDEGEPIIGQLAFLKVFAQEFKEHMLKQKASLNLLLDKNCNLGVPMSIHELDKPCEYGCLNRKVGVCESKEHNHFAEDGQMPTDLACPGIPLFDSDGVMLCSKGRKFFWDHTTCYGCNIVNYQGNVPMQAEIRVPGMEQSADRAVDSIENFVTEAREISKEMNQKMDRATYAVVALSSVLVVASVISLAFAIKGKQVEEVSTPIDLIDDKDMQVRIDPMSDERFIAPLETLGVDERDRGKKMPHGLDVYATVDPKTLNSDVSNTTTLENLKNTIRREMVYIKFRTPDKEREVVGRGIRFTANTILINKHYMKSLADKTEVKIWAVDHPNNIDTIIFNASQSMIIGHDLAVIRTGCKRLNGVYKHIATTTPDQTKAFFFNESECREVFALKQTVVMNGVTHDCYKYVMPENADGDCMSALIGVSASGNAAIIGFHNASHDSNSYAQLVDMKSAAAAIYKYQSPEGYALMLYRSPDSDTSDKSVTFKVGSVNVVNLGSDKNTSSPPKSNFAYTGIAKADIISPESTGLIIPDFSNVSKTPWQTFKNHHIKGEIDFEEEEQWIKMYLKDIKPFKWQMASTKSVINGVDGDPYMKSIDKTTAPGMEYTTYGISRKTLLRDGKIDPTLEKTVDNTLKIARKRVPVQLVNNFPKDAPTTPDKNDNADHRFVTTLPFDNLIAQKKVFSHMLANIAENSKDWHMCHGQNMASKEFADRMHEVYTKWPYPKGGDFSKQEASHDISIAGTATVMFLEKLAEKCEVGEEFKSIILNMALSVFITIQYTNGDYNLVDKRIPSGSLLTLFINSLMTIRTYYISWIRLKRRQGYEVIPDFREHNLLETQGDDGTHNGDDPEFTMALWINTSRRSGYNATGPNKEPEHECPPYFDINMPFCKRTCVYNEGFGCYTMALAESSLDKTLVFFDKSGSVPYAERMSSASVGVQIEAALRSEECLKRYQDILDRGCKVPGWEFRYKKFSFQDIKKWFYNDGKFKDFEPVKDIVYLEEDVYDYQAPFKANNFIPDFVAVAQMNSERHDITQFAMSEEQEEVEETVGNPTWTTLPTGPKLPLNEFLARPMQIAQFPWSTGGGTPDTLNVYSTYFALPLVANRLSGYRYFKGQPTLTAMMVGNKFYYGRKRLCMVYRIGYDPDAGITNNSYIDMVSFAQAIQQDGIDLDATQDVQTTYKFTFASTTGWLDLIDPDHGGVEAEAHIFNITNPSLASVNDVAPDTLTITLFLHWENVELSVPVAIGQMEDDRDGEQGKLSSKLADVSKAIDTVSEAAPAVAPVLNPISAVGKVGSSILSAMGHSKPVVQEEEMVQVKTQDTMAYTDGFMNAETLGANKLVSTSISATATGFGEDSDGDIMGIMRRWGIIDRVNWTGTTLDRNSWAVLPGGYYNDVTLGTAHVYTPLSYMASQFAYCKGGTEIRIDAVCSDMHKGLLNILYSPNQSLRNGSYGDKNVYWLNAVMDISKTKSMVFKIPWAQDFPFRRVEVNNTNATPAADADMGFIAIDVKSPLTTVGSASPINLIIYIRAGEDFALARPTMANNIIREATGFSPQGGNDPDSDEMWVGSGYVANTNDEIFSTHFGERITTVQQLCKRQTWCMQVIYGNVPGGSPLSAYNAMTRFTLPVPMTGSSNGTNALFDLYTSASFNEHSFLSWNAQIFLGFRGSIVYTIESPGSAIADLTFNSDPQSHGFWVSYEMAGAAGQFSYSDSRLTRPTSGQTQYQFCRPYVIDSSNGAVFVNYNVQGLGTFRVPYTNVGRVYNGRAQTQWSNTTRVVTLTFPGNYSRKVVNVWIGAGDDMIFSKFQFVPVLSNRTAIV